MVCFFGPDGSGKSTLVKFLRGYLFSRGVYAYISWFRGSHLVASLLARFLSRFTVFRGFGNPYYGISVPSRLRFVWLFIEFSSILPYYFLRRFLSLFGCVVGDRCLLDFIVWVIVTLDYPRFLSTILGRFLSRLAFNGVLVYVTADYRVLSVRAPSTPSWFLLREEACYSVLSRYYASCVIDTTSMSPRESFSELLRCLREL
ncbi:MAG: hypothetical protein QW607_12435 [Desulfurococcaceae archaeon]